MTGPSVLGSLLDFDRGYRGRGARVVGVDEAGRGPLAGPVLAAAVVFDLDAVALSELAEINDSKQLDAPTRERLEPLIWRHAVAWSVASADVAEIDSLNILRASHLAMRRALQPIVAPDDFVLVDGLPVPGLHPRGEAVVDGDAQSISIAAAGILAKVARDRIMRAEHVRFPDYCFDQHKGYCTPLHRLALEVFGSCPLHRRSFAPVAENLEPRTPARCFWDLRRRLAEVRDAGRWHVLTCELEQAAGELSLPESRLLGLLLLHAAQSLALPAKFIRGCLAPVHDAVGPFEPANAPLFAAVDAGPSRE